MNKPKTIEERVEEITKQIFHGSPSMQYMEEVLHQALTEHEETIRAEYEQFTSIKRIHANFRKNGLVEETGDKLNEIIDAVNKLQSLTPKHND